MGINKTYRFPACSINFEILDILVKPGQLWHRFLVTPKSVRKTGRKAGSKQKAGAKKKASSKKAPASLAKRIEYLESMLNLLLKASLRGHLLPSERRIVKKAIEKQKKVKIKEPLKKKEPRCPACRSLLENPRVERCPYCSVLLGELRRLSKKRKRS
jgi:RNase P subunit RPR2